MLSYRQALQKESLKLANINLHPEMLSMPVSIEPKHKNNVS